MTSPDPLAPSRSRLRLLALGFLLAFALVGARLVQLLLAEPAAELARPDGAPATAGRRADILDRNGRVLATDIPSVTLALDPLYVRDPAATARRLAAVLEGVDEAALARRLARHGSRYAPVKRHLLPREQRAVLELGLPGTILETRWRRVYPEGDLFAPLLGAVGADGQGLAGVEYAFDRRLRSRPGEPLRLVVDLRVQHVLREELEAAFRRFRAIGACGLVLDVRTGDLLAEVSLPTFDPHRFAEAREEVRLDRCTGAVYELGSVFKLVTAAMALESGRVGLGDRFDARGPYRIGRFRIRDVHDYGRALTVPEIIAFSSNIGTVQMALAAGGAASMRAFLTRLGFHRPLDWPLPERARPLFPRRWPEITVATVAFGHGIAVSPLQYARAVAALAGDGRPRRLRLLAATPVEAGPAVVRPETAEALRWLMWLVVERGTGSKAASSSYLIGGKTGTADKPARGRRGYDTSRTVSSFVGLFPLEAPRYLVMVVLDEPQGDEGTFGFRYGGWTAAPVVGAVIDRIGPLLGVPPSAEEARRPFVQRLRERQEVDPASGRREKRLAFVAADRP